MAEFFNEASSSPAQVREQPVAGRGQQVDAIYDRATARGEIDPATLIGRRRTLALDLLRNEFMMTLRPVSRKSIEQIVDDIVLPLLTQPTAQAGTTA